MDEPTPWRPAMRQAMRARRRALAADDLRSAAHDLARWARTIPALTAARAIGAYMAVDGEIDVLPAVLGLPTPLGLPAILAIPHLDTAHPGTMTLLPWVPGEPLTANQWGIPEPPTDGRAGLKPEELNVVLLPALAVDSAGTRLGMGGGYFDRWLAQTPPDAADRPVLIAVVHDFQVVDHLEPQPWDVPAHLLLTPSRVLYCRP